MGRDTLQTGARRTNRTQDNRLHNQRVDGPLDPVMFEEVKIHLLSKYVDDCFMAVDRMRLGVRWDAKNKAMMWTPETEQEDRENNVDPDILTMREIAKMAGDIEKCLRFTFDTPRMNKSGSMPVLDTQIWMEEEQRETGIPRDMVNNGDIIKMKTGQLERVVAYKFYQKPMVH